MDVVDKVVAAVAAVAVKAVLFVRMVPALAVAVAAVAAKVDQEVLVDVAVVHLSDFTWKVMEQMEMLSNLDLFQALPVLVDWVAPVERVALVVVVDWEVLTADQKSVVVETVETVETAELVGLVEQVNLEFHWLFISIQVYH